MKKIKKHLYKHRRKYIILLVCLILTYPVLRYIEHVVLFPAAHSTIAPYRQSKCTQKTMKADGEIISYAEYTCEKPSGNNFIVYCGGNAEDVAHGTAKGLDTLGYCLKANGITVDPPGYGKSTGKIRHARDLYKNVYKVIRQCAPKGSNIILVGYSMGCHATLKIAPTLLKAGYTVEIILINPYNRCIDLYPFFLKWVGKIGIGKELDNYSAIENINGVPILFAHGEGDPIVPEKETQKLYEGYPHQKRIFCHGSSGHCITDQVLYWCVQELGDFRKSCANGHT